MYVSCVRVYECVCMMITMRQQPSTSPLLLREGGDLETTQASKGKQGDSDSTPPSLPPDFMVRIATQDKTSSTRKHLLTLTPTSCFVSP